ncbi:MAG: zinc-binding dehydrogenase [Paracoccus sp. (in: a-proteobacteria)]|uniref:zinc-binding dehydrogenase n=1 Tax=Paracoccus sp. TaxID=267 RepID=UPI0026E05C53|nr:zinc-binding dehydrogenase [Paracoccus sp. (in: a-proteobacteria)]MDO5633197.1 zinc-binding dehydrogenase [Paracoccus sp. (in: a-proteobacteria)]
MVEAVGAGVTTTTKPDDRVSFARQPGTYVGACLVNADSLIPLPEDISFEQGAAFPLQGMTAHYLIHDFRQPHPGNVALIHAAAGGVGLMLVQWARHLGARVIGTVSTEDKARAVRQAGADEVINYSRSDFAAETLRLNGSHGADLIIDGVSKAIFPGNLAAAALRGHIMIFGAANGPADPASPNALMTRSLTVSGGDLRHFPTDRDQMLRRVRDTLAGIRDDGLNLPVFATLLLAEASKAHQMLEKLSKQRQDILTP